MKQTIYLEATLNQGILKIGIRQARPIWTYYEDATVPLKDVEQICHKLAETLNQNNRKHSKEANAADSLKRVGRLLGDLLFPPKIKEELQNTDAEYLILELDNHLVHIPWELIYIGEASLCQRFGMGRWVKTRQKIVGNNHRHLKNPLDMWILVNSGKDLPNVASEGRNIFRYVNRANQNKTIINPFIDDVTPEQIQSNIKDYDIVHFAGHAKYYSQSDGAGASAWILSNGNFTADDIYKMAGGNSMPALVFSNACQSARTEAWNQEGDSEPSGAFGLGNAFLFAGVSHYIGTFWEISDEPSSYFALEFYKALFAGMTIGEAVRKARCISKEKYGKNFTGWASYLLYGDPRFSYFGENREIEETLERPKNLFQTLKGNNKKRGESASSVHPSSFSQNRKDNIVIQPEKRNTQTWMILFLFIILSVLGYIGISGYFQIETAKLMQKEAQRKEEQIRFIMEKIAKKIPAPSVVQSDKPTAKSLTMAILYDSIKSAYSQAKENMIASVVEMEIKEQCPKIRLVERKEFDIVLKELDLALSPLVPPENQLHPKLLNAKLILFIETSTSFFQTYLLMRLIDTQTSESFALPIKKLKRGRIASQHLAKDVLKILKNNYHQISSGVQK